LQTFEADGTLLGAVEGGFGISAAFFAACLIFAEAAVFWLLV
jgi:hypothetical protein